MRFSKLLCRYLTSSELDKFVAVNEPIREYLPGSTDIQRLEKRLAYYSNTCVDVPIVIGDEEIYTKDVRYQVMVYIILHCSGRSSVNELLHQSVLLENNNVNSVNSLPFVKKLFYSVFIIFVAIRSPEENSTVFVR